MKALIASVVIAMSLGVAMLGPFGDVTAGDKSAEAEKPAALWQSAAQSQEGFAQPNLGLAYNSGKTGPSDFSEVVRWHKLAAAQGDAVAQNNLGVMYYLGRGVSQDFAEAVRWWRAAANQGHANAQFNLGNI